ncbi:hypothetical protein [Kosmotoga pacifica]|nr:hypothetical protein [Kosmotoga pacifica]
MFRKIFMVLIIVIPVMSLSLPLYESDYVPGMIRYEFKIVDIAYELSSELNLEELIISNGSLEQNYLSLIPITESSGKLMVVLKEIFARVGYTSSENYYRIEVGPEIVTTMGNPGSLSFQKDKFNIRDYAYTRDIVLISVLPEKRDNGHRLYSRLNVYISGEYSVRLTTIVRHKEDEWVPVALLQYKQNQETGKTAGTGNRSFNRYAILSLCAREIIPESTTSGRDLFVWSDMSGLDTLFSPAQRSKYPRSSYLDLLFGFTQLGLNKFSGELSLMVANSVILGIGLEFDALASSISSLNLFTGITGEDGLLLKLSGSYIPEEIEERKINLLIGFEDITQPNDVLRLGAAWYPLTIYPFETGENAFELTNYWSFEGGVISKTGVLLSVKIDGNPLPNRISAKVGYATESFEFSVGFYFELELWE